MKFYIAVSLLFFFEVVKFYLGTNVGCSLLSSSTVRFTHDALRALLATPTNELTTVYT